MHTGPVARDHALAQAGAELPNVVVHASENPMTQYRRMLPWLPHPLVRPPALVQRHLRRAIALHREHQLHARIEARRERVLAGGITGKASCPCSWLISTLSFTVNVKSLRLAVEHQRVRPGVPRERCDGLDARRRGGVVTSGTPCTARATCASR